MDSKGKAAKKISKQKSYSSEAKESSTSDLDHLKTKQIKSLLSDGESKDKTQVAATTSMGLIQIGILKALLDVGPSADLPYYPWCLGFVVAALVLQFLSGVVAIYIATMKSFVSHFNRDFGYYCTKNCCPCLLSGWHPDGPEFERQVEQGGSGFADGEMQRLVVGRASQPEDLNNCCSSCCGPDELEYDEMVLQEHDTWMKKSFKMHEEAANAAQEIKWMEEHIKELEKERDDLLRQGLDTDDPKIVDIDEVLQAEATRHTQMTEKQRAWRLFKRKGDIQRQHLQAVVDEKVMKKAASWQCVLTMLTYIVLTLNALITGFGLANLTGGGQKGVSVE